MIRKAVQSLTPYTPGEQPKIDNLIKLNTNENAYPPSPKISAALGAFNASVLHRYPDPLCIRIRKILATRHKCTTENIFVGNGSDEILRLATYAWVEDHGAIGYFTPSYSLYPVLTDIRDVKHAKYTLPKPGALSACLQSLQGQTLPDLFFITNPNAPTSTQFSKAEMQHFCVNYPGVVFIDEAYVDFAEEDCVELACSMPNVIVCRTFSKAWSLAGIRLGYAMGPASLIEALYKIKDSYNVNALTQAVAIAALSDPDWMLKNRSKIIATRKHLTQSLREQGWTVADSATNFLWCMPPPPTDAESIWKKLRSHGIVARYFPGPETGTHIRITIGTDEQTNVLLDVLKKEL